MYPEVQILFSAPTKKTPDGVFFSWDKTGIEEDLRVEAVLREQNALP